jgi:hypothetical protein
MPHMQPGLDPRNQAEALAEITSLIRRELPDAEARAATWTEAVQRVCQRIYGHEWPLVATGEVRCPHCFKVKPSGGASSTATTTTTGATPLNLALPLPAPGMPEESVQHG